MTKGGAKPKDMGVAKPKTKTKLKRTATRAHRTRVVGDSGDPRTALAPNGETTQPTPGAVCAPPQSLPADGPNLFQRLGSPRAVMAPMVHGSERAFRLLCRRYGAQLCYTPMWSAAAMRADPQYAAAVIADAACAQDRPLIMQFQATSGADLAAAAAMVAPHVDAVDLNLGCPQFCAERGGYGAYLMDDLAKVADIVATAAAACAVPLTAKIRVFDDEAQTVAYARLLERSGIQMLAVHGRRREDRDGAVPADWAQILAVKRAVRIPVLANGGVLWYGDVQRCLSATGCDGAMVGNALLWDPRLFANPELPLLPGYLFDLPPPADAVGAAVAAEYLGLVRQHPAPYLYVFHHLKRLVYHCVRRQPETVLMLLELQLQEEGTGETEGCRKGLLGQLKLIVDEFVLRAGAGGGAGGGVVTGVGAGAGLRPRGVASVPDRVSGLLKEPNTWFAMRAGVTRWAQPKALFSSVKGPLRDEFRRAQEETPEAGPGGPVEEDVIGLRQRLWALDSRGGGDAGRARKAGRVVKEEARRVPDGGRKPKYPSLTIRKPKVKNAKELKARARAKAFSRAGWGSR